jgi:GT2 family glycosyltransferase
MVVAPGRNVGFAGGCDLGARLARAKGAQWLWFLNNDAIAEPGALENLVAVSADERVGGLGSLVVLYDCPDVVQWSVGWFRRLARGIRMAPRSPRRDWEGREALVAAFLPACSLMIPVDVYFSVGGFDASLFMYLEDADLCKRMGAAGYYLELVPSSVVRHKGGRSGGGVWGSVGAFYYVRNRLWFLRRYGGHPLFKLVSLVWLVLELMFRTLLGRPNLWSRRRAILAGLRDGLRQSMVGETAAAG